MGTKQFFYDLWQNEAELTLKAIRAVPEERTDYSPHPKGRTAQQLADHIAAHFFDLVQGFEKTEVHIDPTLRYNSIAEVCDAIEKSSSRLSALLQQADDETWNGKRVPIFALGFKLYDFHLRDFCFRWLLNIVHHRGQLSTYYRAMGTVPPNIYGPNAEETEAMLAKMAQGT